MRRECVLILLAKRMHELRGILSWMWESRSRISMGTGISASFTWPGTVFLQRIAGPFLASLLVIALTPTIGLAEEANGNPPQAQGTDSKDSQVAPQTEDLPVLIQSQNPAFLPGTESPAPESQGPGSLLPCDADYGCVDWASCDLFWHACVETPWSSCWQNVCYQQAPW